jgi:hypothetical protein
MNCILAIVLGLTMGVAPAKIEKKEFEVYKLSGVMVAVDSIESVEQTDKGCTVHLESGQRVYVAKNWYAVQELIQTALEKDQEFVVLYQRKFLPITKSHIKNPL